MPIQVVDLKAWGEDPDSSRKVLMNGPNMNAFFHVYQKPGQKDRMHCHNADGTFYVIEGECTMHFPDGGKAVLKPGMAGLITGGSFYQLENTGTGPMVMMGHHSRCSEESKTILHETREELIREGRPKEPRPKPTHTTILV
jgi:mannose-6-phosphate isomerase-like protein (cupin superfamily)